LVLHTGYFWEDFTETFSKTVSYVQPPLAKLRLDITKQLTLPAPPGSRIFIYGQISIVLGKIIKDKGRGFPI
jgi:hypothetical protein